MYDQIAIVFYIVFVSFNHINVTQEIFTIIIFFIYNILKTLAAF